MSRQILVLENITTKALLAYFLHLGLGPDQSGYLYTGYHRQSAAGQLRAEQCRGGTDHILGAGGKDQMGGHTGSCPGGSQLRGGHQPVQDHLPQVCV